MPIFIVGLIARLNVRNREKGGRGWLFGNFGHQIRPPLVMQKVFRNYFDYLS